MTLRSRAGAIIVIASSDDKIGSPNSLFLSSSTKRACCSSASLPHCAVTRANELRCRIDDTRLRVIVFVRSAPRPLLFRAHSARRHAGSSRANAFSFRALLPVPFLHGVITIVTPRRGGAPALFRKFRSRRISAHMC